MVARSRNLNLLDGVTWDETIKSVKITNINDIYDPTNFDLPWFGNNELGVDNWVGYFYHHTKLTYTITPKVGSPVNVSKMMYVVDLPTAKDLAQYVPVYTTGNQLVQADPNVRRTCELQVSASKIVVPRHPLYVCYGCNEEIYQSDYDWVEEHCFVTGQGPDCGSGWYTDVESFVVTR